MSDCPRCQSSLPAEATACPRCGAAISAVGAFDLDLKGPSGSLAPGLARQQGKQTGLRIGADGQLAVPRAATQTALPRNIGLDEDGFDPFEIRAFADYGEPPTQIYLTPLYSLRVRKRQAELRLELAERKARVTALESSIEDAIVAFAERARSVAESNPVYSRALMPIAEVEALLFSRDSALASEHENFKRVCAEVDGKLSALDARIAKIDADSKDLEAELAKLEDSRKRAEARLKRLEIEARAGAVGPERDAERAAQEAELERLTPLLAAAKRKLDAPRAARAAVEREAGPLRKARGDAAERLRRQTSTRSAGVDDAHKRLRVALSDFGRTALMDNKTFGADFDGARMSVEGLVRERQEKERAVLQVEKAIASADELVVKRGYTAAAVAGVVFLLLVVGVPLMRVLVPHKPPPLYPVE